MRVLNLQEGELKAEAESLEDLWALSKLIEDGDRLEADSFRRAKQEDRLRPDSGEKKRVRLEIEVESAEFAENANKLRVSGRILSGSPEEYVQHGAFHTIDLAVRGRFVLRKHFLKYHLHLLKEARKKSRKLQALVVVLDERKALLAVVRNRGVKFLFELESKASKREPKRFEEEQKKFFSELLQAVQQRGAKKVLLAGPGFAPQQFGKFVQDKDPASSQKISVEHASNSEKTAVFELLKRGALQRILGQEKIQEEFAALEKLKESLAKENGLACYGLREVKEAIRASAVEKLLVSDGLLRKDKELNALLEEAEKKGAQLIVFDSTDEAGAEFLSFQVAALLRFKLRY